MSDTSERNDDAARDASELNVDPAKLESDAAEAKKQREEAGGSEPSLQEHHNPDTDDDSVSGGSAASEADGTGE